MVPKPLIPRAGMKGWVFINHMGAQAQRSLFGDTSSRGPPQPSLFLFLTPGPSEDTVHVAWIKTPQYIKGL